MTSNGGGTNAGSIAPDTQGSNLRGQGNFGSSLKWSYIMDGGRQLSLIIVSLVIARIVGPENWGIIALATLAILMMELLHRHSLQPAIIQRDEVGDDTLHTAFWISVAFAVFLASLVVVFAGPYSRLIEIDDPVEFAEKSTELRNVLWVLAITLPIRSLTLINEAMMQRAMDFKRLATPTNGSTILGGIVGVIMAIAGYGIWAMVGQQLVQVASAAFLIFKVDAWRPSMRFVGDKARELTRFSSGSAVMSLGNVINERGADILIGAMFGPLAVGLYRFASRFVTMLLNIATNALGAISIPELSRHQHDPDAFNARVIDLIKASTVLTFPLLAILAINAQSLIDLMGSGDGNEWNDAVVPLQLLCLWAAGRAMLGFVTPMLEALGRPHDAAKLAWAAAAISLLAFYLGGVLLGDSAVGTQIAGIAALRLVVTVGLLLPMYMAVVRHITGASVSQIASAIAPSVFAALTVVIVGLSTTWLLDIVDPHFLIRLVVVGLATTTAALVALAKTEPTIRAKIATISAKRSAPTAETPTAAEPQHTSIS